MKNELNELYLMEIRLWERGKTMTEKQTNIEIDDRILKFRLLFI